MRKDDMSQEKKPFVRKLLPEGWREFTVLTCEPSVSKGGNEMVIVELQDAETQYVDKVYLVSVQGKRWLLKNLLTACGIAAGADGVYEWDFKDIIGKQIEGLVEHEDNEWINRDGDKITTRQHRIAEFRTMEEKAWDEK